MVYTQRDFALMRHALELARSGLGTTAPNPSVGCVIVKDGAIVGQGNTQKNGRPHAETVALKEAGDLAIGATAYVTLEPCSHHGKTPPCAKSLIEGKIKKVFIATKDISAKVNGAGIKMLEDAQVEVVVGLCEAEAIKLNEGFFSVQKKSRPFVTLKLATTIDGKIATKNGDSKWITNSKAREYVHNLRATNDAILVGIGTVLADDPLLNCRLKGFEDRKTLRVILDSKLRTPKSSQLVKTSKKIPTLIYTKKSKKFGSIEVVAAPLSEGHLDIKFILEDLAKRGITRILVEGGSKVATSFLKQNLVDELIWIRAPIIIGNDGLAGISNLNFSQLSSALQFSLTDLQNIEGNILEVYRTAS